MNIDEFTRAWWAFARQWKKAGGLDNSEKALAQIDALVQVGLRTPKQLAQPKSPPKPPPAATLLACEIAVLRRAQAVDQEAYRRAFAEVKAAVDDPVRHFCESGWRALANPGPDMDLWWYWFEHLDPRDDTINPMLHYVLSGRHDALSTLPTISEPITPTRLGPEEKPRRVCLFAGYDADGIVDEYVIDYIAELARHADVYYLADATLSSDELAKLAAITKGSWSIRHNGYDFGSWSMLARDLVGWDELATYDEVLFVNDSAYLLRPLDEVFARMDRVEADWWGLHATRRAYAVDTGHTRPLSMSEAIDQWATKNDVNPLDHLHVSSYFLAVRQPVVADPEFRRRLDSVCHQRAKQSIILKYEIGMSRFLFTRGYRLATYVDELYPFMPIYSADYWSLLNDGFPLFKRNFLTANPRRVPDLADWKERITAVVPDAPVECFERNLVRTTADDQRERNFAIRSHGDGTIDYHTPLSWQRVRIEDRWAPKFDHWWAFPVCGIDHTLAGNERAVFEDVRQDPSIKKIVLTRSRAVDVDGENVVVVPLISRLGQHYLTRARQIFVKHGPQFNAHWPLSPRTHNFINLWHGIPLKRFGSASVEITSELEKVLRRDNGGCRAVITSSHIDRLSMSTAFWPMSYPDTWNTGLPRNDYIICSPDRLPADLRADEDALRAEVGDRRLVMFLPTYKVNQLDAYYQFSPEELEELGAWTTRHNAVLGVREHMADKTRSYWHQLAPLGSIDLSSRRFPSLEVLYRVADGLVSDYSSCLVDFLLTDKPVASFAYDLDRYSTEERGLFYDLEKAIPGPVCRSFPELVRALDRFFDETDAGAREEYVWRRGIFFDHVDDRSARRVTQRVRSLYADDA